VTLSHNINSAVRYICSTLYCQKYCYWSFDRSLLGWFYFILC